VHSGDGLAGLWLGPVNAGRCGVRRETRFWQRAGDESVSIDLSRWRGSHLQCRAPSWAAVGAFGDAVWIASLDHDVRCGLVGDEAFSALRTQPVDLGPRGV
jgi:hypothetical protein